MNLPYSWLSDFTDIGENDIKAYCDRMTDTGSKVEGYEVLGEDIQNVIVGRVTEMARHENSDHLWVCQIDIGSETVQIVTGAQNVNVGDLVPAAIPPAFLPGGVKIKKGALRGVESNGMLCSIAELGLTLNDMPGAAEDGIFILNESLGLKVGDDIVTALGLRETVVEFEITPNRPDCLSIIGLARESAASYGKTLSVKTPVFTTANDGDKIDNYLSVTNEATDLCARYSARVVKNVKIEPSPLWLRMRLRAAGVRPINNIVDITNYVMLEYGQPMHAFDYKCLDGSKIVVRRADDGEKFVSLDDVPHDLRSDMLVIADEKKAVALAGVMGGLNSEITDDTVTVVFESANFLGSSVRVTSRALGMRTESSARFEKGLDPENALPALDRACELINMLSAGEVVDGTIDVYNDPKPATVLPLEVDKINRFLGTDLTGEYMESVLKLLCFEVKDSMITVPSYRSDVECMNDIAEEVIRIYGYNEIQSTPFFSRLTQGGRTEEQSFSLRLHELLCGMGLYEIDTFSFISPKFYDRIELPADDSRRNCVVIKNPLGEDTSVMRTTAIPSMMDVLARNYNYGNEAAALYELATVYIPNEDKSLLPAENRQLVVGFYGKGDFYRLKGMCEDILKLAGIRDAEYVRNENDPTFHGGRCADVICRGKTVATLGEIHPTVLSNYSVGTPVFLMALDYEALYALRDTAEFHYTPLPKFPAMTRDFAFLCDDEIEVAAIEKVMKKAGGKLLRDIKLFDVYRGKQIEAGKKSVAFSVSLRADDRTLTDEDADRAVTKILNTLEKEMNITLRK
ncbi:MAG: phenylalanine--tRNA ligase subunit beta [Clostridia bacterium]|nr:phenylalanine--tRNA ligase subunit beta [Clostridia bacterium]